MHTRYLVTGGAGFIGSNLVHRILEQTDSSVVVLDALTYAGNLDNLASQQHNPHFHFVHGNICDGAKVRQVLHEHRPSVVFNLAAESHVDRSIDGPKAFVHTNVVGTLELLEAVRETFCGWSKEEVERFRFVHISTDEVYGSLGETGTFTERSQYAPNSPYAASKAGADHLVRAYFHTFGLPTLTTNCSNNYGPYQFPEKLIPLVILNALEGKSLPVYGDGKNIRDWLYVQDHCEALITVAHNASPGQVYNVGGRCERTTLQIVETICDVLDSLMPPQSNRSIQTAHPSLRSYRELIRFVTDRPGHDRRYAIDATKLETDLEWIPQTPFEKGIRETVQWYLDNQTWCKRITEGVYRRERLGLSDG